MITRALRGTQLFSDSHSFNGLNLITFLRKVFFTRTNNNLKAKLSNLKRDETDEIKALLEQLEKMESVEDSEGPISFYMKSRDSIVWGSKSPSS